MTLKKCPLCSKLSSKLRKLLEKCLGLGNPCNRVHQNTLKHNDPARADKLSAAVPACGCEHFRTSTFSPGCVEDGEMLSMFMFDPEQITKKGKVKPALFDQINNKGRSIQRDSIAEDDELTSFVSNFLSIKSTRKWRGVVSASCRNVRGIKLHDHDDRAICVFDTAEQNNPAHGEMCRAKVMDEADQAELRSEIWKAFDAGNVITSENYRSGTIWARLSDELRKTSSIA